MQQVVMGGVGMQRSTDLLLWDVTELYPDLLLGRRLVMVRDDNDR